MTQSIRTRLCFEKLEAREVHAFLTPVASPIDFDKTGDFNGDGRADLISVDSATSKLTVRLGNGDGTFATAKTTTLSGTPNIRAVADLNADGKDDVVLTLGGSEMALMLSNGNGTFTKSSSSPVLAKVTVPGNNKPQTQRASSIVVGDLNGDSLLDLAVIGNWATTSNGVISGSAAYLNVFYAKGVGGFTAKPPVFLMSGPRMYAVNPEVHLADLAGDGRPEVLAVDSHLGTKVLTAQPDGSFQLTKSTSQFNGGPVTHQRVTDSEQGRADENTE